MRLLFKSGYYIIPNPYTTLRFFSGILHANVGSEVGAMITQSWIESFIAEYDATDLTDEIENTKILENYLYFACCLYAFHVYGHDLIFNIFTKFVESYKVKDVELIILLLRCIGFNLRKDDPTKLKSLIVDIQKKATQDTVFFFSFFCSRLHFFFCLRLYVLNDY